MKPNLLRLCARSFNRHSPYFNGIFANNNTSKITVVWCRNTSILVPFCSFKVAPNWHQRGAILLGRLTSDENHYDRADMGQ